MNIEKLIKDNVAKLSETLCKVYISPDIPEKKLNNAIAAIAPNVDPNYVLAVVDTTLLGSAKDGIVFVGDKMYLKYLSSTVDVSFDKIESIKKEEETQTSSSGDTKIKYHYVLKEQDKNIDMDSYISSVNKEGFMALMNLIIEEVKENDGALESTNQICPLAMMSSDIKEAYLKVICNFEYSDDGIVDADEYAEIMSLIAMNSIEKEVRIAIRAYMYDVSNQEDNDKLIAFLEEKVDAGSLDALKLSLVKDTINLYWPKMSPEHKVDEWKGCQYIVDLVKKLNIGDDQVDYISENIKKNKEIIEKRQDDVMIKKTMQDLFSKAGAVGVPLAAVYLSGSVIGVSAAGMTSGLAALGMGGVLGFSSMFTGIGVAVLLGIGTYKGVRKITGMGDLEKNKQREMMLQEIAKNSQKALNYLIEDVNEITSKLQQAIAKEQENEIKINKLAGILSMMSRGATKTSNQIDFAEKESLICKLPKRIKRDVIEELAPGATKANIRELIFNAYNRNQTDEEGNTLENCLDTDMSLGDMENVYNSLEGIGYYSVAGNAKAQVVNGAKGLVKGLFG